MRLLISLLTILPCGGLSSNALAAPPAGRDADAVKSVMTGLRTTANAAWWGFNDTNSTVALQAALCSGARTVIVPNMNKPWRVDPILLESDQELVFEPGTVVEARRGSFMGLGDALFKAKGKQHILIRGHGTIWQMHKEDYVRPPYRKGEWRHGLALLACHDVTVQGLTIARSGGDGIYVGSGCRDIVVRDVTCEANHRQGISVISAENLLIERCTLRATQGTSPQAGIDFEPNYASERLVNCTLRNCVIEDNRGAGVQLYLKNLKRSSRPISIVIERCRIRGNRWPNVILAKSRGADKPGGTIRFVDCSIGWWRWCEHPEKFTLEFITTGK